MRGKKPFKIIEERLKNNYIVIELFKRRNHFSYGVSASIGAGGIGHPEHGNYKTFFEAKNAALHLVKKCHKDPLQIELLKKFHIMKDLDQPLLFYD